MQGSVSAGRKNCPCSACVVSA